MRIGVLGGIGPEASANFYKKLIIGLQERGLIKNNGDYPQIIINSIPAPELVYDEVLDMDLVDYINGLRELDSLGVDFIVMVCNTIYLFVDKLQRRIKAPILDLRKEVEELLVKRGIKSVLVIGSPSTIRLGLYNFDNIYTFIPNDKEINDLSNTVFNFNKGINKKSRVVSICKKYLSKGAQAIILGCTELAVMLGNEGFPCINTIDVLVDATIKRCGGDLR